MHFHLSGVWASINMIQRGQSKPAVVFSKDRAARLGDFLAATPPRLCGRLLFGCDGFSATHRNLTKAEQGPITPDMRTSLALHSLTILALLTSHWTLAAEPDKEGFVPIFDGKTLNGWHASAKTGHSSVSKHQSGGRWVVEDGAITGSQDIPGNGGIFITDEKFGDFEIILEMNNDFGPDSGLFLRSTEDGDGLPGDDRLPHGRQSHGNLRRRRARW